MKLEDILKLITTLKENEVAEFKLKQNDFKLNIKSKAYTEALINSKNKVINTVATQPAQIVQNTPASNNQNLAVTESQPTLNTDSKADNLNSNSIEIKSPMVGTFYRSPSPDKPVFVKVGDRIEKGQTICIVEAMKLFNEIESEVSGTIVKVLLDDASPVEYDQAIMLIDPS